ncbi:pirin family protein [Derxia gummosa]|uniref:Pirin family protein n=1 Tax=Derxia gummosa DSM 723 TaxID=1121388 RepID=A0A8B6X9L9_9BURK|nr:pirin family protein [Derxia gummosa]
MSIFTTTDAATSGGSTATTSPVTAVANPRRVERIVIGHPTSDGAGVKLTRVIDHRLQRRLDPLLMLDNFSSDSPDDYVAGFPDHPHRGFQTVTYMIQGRMRHRDSAGHEGLLENGSVQWMNAGSGLIHSEMPEQEDGRMEGFQLWINLPSHQKLSAPAYQDIAPAEVPELQLAGGGLVRVIAGEAGGVRGAVRGEFTEPVYLDVHLPPGARFAQPLPAGHNAVVATYRGTATVGGEAVESARMAILANDTAADGVVIANDGPDELRAVLIAGKPLNEPIVQYGPFVMNTQEEIVQAIADYREGRMG